MVAFDVQQAVVNLMLWFSSSHINGLRDMTFPKQYLFVLPLQRHHLAGWGHIRHMYIVACCAANFHVFYIPAH